MKHEPGTLRFLAAKLNVTRRAFVKQVGLWTAWLVAGPTGCSGDDAAGVDARELNTGNPDASPHDGSLPDGWLPTMPDSAPSDAVAPWPPDAAQSTPDAYRPPDAAQSTPDAYRPPDAAQSTPDAYRPPDAATPDARPDATPVDALVTDAAPSVPDATNTGGVRVYLVRNGTFTQNVNKTLELLGGIGAYVDATDVVVIKANGQWPLQGYTHTGCIKAVIDQVLAIPSFSGEVLICDNVQEYGEAGQTGFDVLSGWRRNNNWPDHNWTTLAAAYQAANRPVAVKRWTNSTSSISGPADGDGWIRDFFAFHGENAFLSYPIFESPNTPGRMIDMRQGVWENGGYTGRKVKCIVMPTLNNHGWGDEDYAGVTSAVKSFFGATEMHGGTSGQFMGASNMHRTTFERDRADYAGELTARFIHNCYAPVLYITAAIYSGWESRMGQAALTNAVLACENPATLDYVACREVLWPSHPAFTFLNPDNDNNTRRQILGCIGGGVGTIDPGQFTTITYTF